MERRELVRKLCLSIGLLQPGDSRDVVVDVLQVILDAKTPLDAEAIIIGVKKNREERGIILLGIAPSNIRRQLKRIKDMMLIEKAGTTYRLTENMTPIQIFEEKIEKYLVASVIERTKEYFMALEHKD